MRKTCHYSWYSPGEVCKVLFDRSVGVVWDGLYSVGAVRKLGINLHSLLDYVYGVGKGYKLKKSRIAAGLLQF
ncbi:MAG: hypothetical protein EA361_16390 [Bacteroidetes bacterium]|nr:MAG: hypothetical protein EA361_16390 [Bacteroidota bacterium]